jgi:hypothetical protein
MFGKDWGFEYGASNASIRECKESGHSGIGERRHLYPFAST